MQYYPFDSRNPIYRSKIGAVKQGESLALRLLLHRDSKTTRAFLRVFDDSDRLHEYELCATEWIEDYRVYECEIVLDEGLYWYDFRYESDFGQFFVGKQGASKGVYSYTCGKRWQLTVYAQDFTTPDWLAGGIIYQIFPDRFYNSGKIKENVPQDRFLTDDWSKTPEHKQTSAPCCLGNDYYGGDLVGIIEKLPYLKDLGVSCIYLNPIFEAHSNHRYNTADYSKVDCLLGDEDDLKRLTAAAGKQGISVILDGVFSHTGDDSIYFNRKKRYGDSGAYNDYNSPYREWYNFSEYPNKYAAWWGVPSLPETNENNPAFTEFITGESGIIKKWLRLGIRGWRLDVADELPDEFLDNIRAALKSEKPDSYLLGEVWEDATNKISYGSRRRFLRGRQLDSVMNYPFANGIIDFIKNGNAQALCDIVLDICENYPPEATRLLMNHIGTHDTARALTVMGKSYEYIGDRDWQAAQKLSADEYSLGIKRLMLAAVVQFTLPGVPAIYYGDEAGVEGYGDPFCRATYPWGNENCDLLAFYKKLGAARRGCDEFKAGEFVPLYASDDVLAYLRRSNKGAVLVALNRGNDTKEIEIPQKFSGKKAIIGVSATDNKMTLKPFEFSIIKQ